MPTMIFDPEFEKELLAVREANGADRYDEVWDGVYVMSPMPNDEHQMIVSALSSILQDLIGWQKLGQVRSGVNISDRIEDWRQNYRVPDVAVFLNHCKAVNRDSFWHGGPDLVVEIISPGERINDKLEFYGRISTSELIVIEREPWAISQYLTTKESLVRTAMAAIGNGVVHCQTAPIDLVLVAGKDRPTITVTGRDVDREWSI